MANETFSGNKANELLKKHASKLGPNARPVRKLKGPLWKPIKRFKEPEEYKAWQQTEDANRSSFLAGWDKNNPEKRGPQGEPLPRGAIDWTPNGEPYYGEGLKGWWNGFVNRIASPYEEKPEDIVATTMAKPTPYAPGDPTERLDIWQTLKNAWNSVGQTETGIGAAFRATQETGKAGIEVLGEFAKKTEQTLGAAQQLQDVANVRAAQEGRPFIMSGRKMGVNSPDYQKWRDYFLKLAPSQSAHDPIDWGKAAREGYQAGRIFYSTILDPMLREEFLRRYRAGENPYFLQQELENPGAELVGQIIIDPLNIIGPLGKGISQARRARAVEKLFFNVSPELADFIKSTDVLSDTRAVGALAGVVDAQKLASTRAARGLSDLTVPLGGNGRFLLRTSTAKQFVIGQETSEFLGWVATSNREHPDLVMDALKALIQRASDDPDEIADGLAFLKSSGVMAPQAHLSEVANRTGVIMRNMLMDADGKINYAKHFDDIGKALAGEPDDLLKMVFQKMNTAVEGMFPSVDDMRKAAAKVRGGRAATEAELALAKKYKELSPAVKAVAAVGERMNKIYRIPNSFFAGVYMGLNPGYAARNFTQNSLQIAIDHGISALFKSKAGALADASALLGGHMPAAVGGFGKGFAGVEVTEAAKGSKLLFSRTMAENFEELGAAQTIYASVQAHHAYRTQAWACPARPARSDGRWTVRDGCQTLREHGVGEQGRCAQGCRCLPWAAQDWRD